MKKTFLLAAFLFAATITNAQVFSIGIDRQTAHQAAFKVTEEITIFEDTKQTETKAVNYYIHEYTDSEGSFIGFSKKKEPNLIFFRTERTYSKLSDGYILFFGYNYARKVKVSRI